MMLSTARGSISKAMKGLVGGAAQGSADCRRNWTRAFIPRSSGFGTHPTSAECADAAEWRTEQFRHIGASRQTNAHRFLPHVKLSPVSAWMPLSPSQELDKEDACSGALTF